MQTQNENKQAIFANQTLTAMARRDADKNVLLLISLVREEKIRPKAAPRESNTVRVNRQIPGPLSRVKFDNLIEGPDTMTGEIHLINLPTIPE
jgi:hypothetical protein